jgi:hypothetical protein
METKDQDEIRYTQNYKIDYAHIDVAQIMDQVKDKASRRAAERAGGDESEACPAGPEVPPPPAEPLTFKKKLKIKVLRFLTPFFPIQRLIALPVHEDLMQTNRHLFEANQRIDDLSRRESFSQNYVKLLHNLTHNLVVELTKLRIEHDTLKSKVQVLEKDFEFLSKREKFLEKNLTR